MSDYLEPIREPRRLRDRLKRKHTTPTAGVPFDRREIVCEGGEAARIEAERQEASEADPEAEWIYLKPEATGRWVARRTPRRGEPEKSKHPFLASLIDALFSAPPS
jgi:hypothetical protein